MSYISTVQPARLRAMPGSTRHIDLPVGVPPVVAPGWSPTQFIGGVEVALLVATLSSVSFELCNIVAGAF